MKKNKDCLVAIFATIGFVVAVAAVVVAVLKFMKKEYHHCDFDFDDDCCDCDDNDDCDCCDENGCAYTDETDFEEE